jgi:hypothetical protein
VYSDGKMLPPYLLSYLMYSGVNVRASGERGSGQGKWSRAFLKRREAGRVVGSRLSAGEERRSSAGMRFIREGMMKQIPHLNPGQPRKRKILVGEA